MGRVSGEEAGRCPWGRRSPLQTPCLPRLTTHIQRQRTLGNVNLDRIAVLDQRNRTSLDGFGANVTNGRTPGRAGEAAVGEQSDAIVETLPSNRRGGEEHFGHSGSSARAFIANDDDVAGLDPAVENRLEGGSLAIEDAGWTTMSKHPFDNGTGLDHATVRSEISTEHGNPSLGQMRILNRPDDVALSLSSPNHLGHHAS
jgi:hypothetical protein